MSLKKVCHPFTHIHTSHKLCFLLSQNTRTHFTKFLIYFYKFLVKAGGHSVESWKSFANRWSRRFWLSSVTFVACPSALNFRENFQTLCVRTWIGRFINLKKTNKKLDEIKNRKIWVGKNGNAFWQTFSEAFFTRFFSTAKKKENLAKCWFFIGKSSTKVFNQSISWAYSRNLINILKF